MEIDKTKDQVGSNSFASPPQKSFIIAQLFFRIQVFSFTIAAVIIAVTSAQLRDLGEGANVQARYSYSSAFRFKFIADCLVCVFSLLSLLFVFALSRRQWNVKYYFYIFLHDLVLLILLTSGCSAGTAVGLVARNGEAKIGWPPICDLFPKFCHKITWSIAFSYLALGCLFILPVLSVAKLKLSAT